MNKKNRTSLSNLVMGSDGIAAQLVDDVHFDPNKWAEAKRIMDAELDRAQTHEDVDRDVVYSMYLIHTIIERFELYNRSSEASAVMDFERWYADRCDGLATDSFYQDWGSEPDDLADAKAEFDRLAKKDGDAE